jgi:hypothetical protein
VHHNFFTLCPYILAQKLTFNATHLNLERAVREGRLIDRSELEPGFVARRKLYVTPDVSSLLDGSGAAGFPTAEAKVRIHDYLAGWLVLAALGTCPKDARPDFCRLRDVDEVWEFCFRKPRPGWRIFGRFFQKDVFIGLVAFDAHDLHRDRQGHVNGAQKAIVEWDTVFPTDQAFWADSLGEYFGGVVRDVS